MDASLYHDDTHATPLDNKVVVVGGGTMGAGIATSLLAVGAEVTLVETTDEYSKAATERVTDSLMRMARRNDTLDVSEALSRFASSVEHPASGVTLVIEAVPEILTLKQKLFAGLAEHYGDGVVFASNTSSLPISTIAEAATHPERVIGMHFFNPVPVSALVEIVVGHDTSPNTIASATSWIDRLGKTPIVVRDSPGFASSRLGIALGMEAIRMLEEGVASAQDIDTAMELGYKHPMGPLRLTDLVGLDVRLAIAEHLADELGERFEPPALLREKVQRGELGKKTGMGFHEWG